MTKSWDIHKAEIKELYSENPLAVVQQIMLERHNFKASTRAYRQRLFKWNVRKYNSRRGNGADCSSSIGSPERSPSPTGSDSPVLSPHSVSDDHHFNSHHGSRAASYGDDGGHGTVLEQSYRAADTATSRTHGGRPRTAEVSSPTDGQRASHAEPYLAPPTASWSHANLPSSPAPYYDYGATTTPLSAPMGVYQQSSYAPNHSYSDRRQTYAPVSTQHSTSMHSTTLPHPFSRDYYGYGQHSPTTDYDSTRHYRDGGRESSDAARRRSRNHY